MIDQRIEISAEARSDLDRHTLWLRHEAGIDTALRFVAAADATVRRLAEMPGMGSPFVTLRPALSELRKWRVSGFPNLLIFYQQLSGGIRVARVLHAAQDWLVHLEGEGG